MLPTMTRKITAARELSGARLRPNPPSALSPHPEQPPPGLPSVGRCVSGAPQLTQRRLVSPPGDRTDPFRCHASPPEPCWCWGWGGRDGGHVSKVARCRGAPAAPPGRDQGLFPSASCFPPPRAGGADVTLTDGRKTEK